MLLIGEREEMAKNAGIGIEFRAKTNFCRLVTNNIFVLLFMIIEVFWVVLVCKKQVICLWTSTVLQNWSNNDDKYSHKFYHFCWTFLCDEWVKDAKKRWHCDYKWVTKWTLGDQNRWVVRRELQIEACITETEVKTFLENNFFKLSNSFMRTLLGKVSMCCQHWIFLRRRCTTHSQQKYGFQHNMDYACNFYGHCST